MLEQLSLPVFAPHLGTTFRIVQDLPQPVDLELLQAEDRGSTPRQERFALVFKGPAHTFLPQRMYAMEHAALGTLDLFIVPVGKDETGFHYEAVFNRLKT